MVPGLMMVARWRCTGDRNPYSPREASAGSSRPTTRMAELATMRRSTSLAVCWAPIRMMPRDRPRSATSSRISLMGLDPSRGAYLFSSSRTTNCRGRAWPERSFSSKALRRTTPTTNRLARSLRLCRSTTVTWWPKSTAWRSACGTSARTRRLRWGTAPHSRRTKALMVPAPMARPAHRWASYSSSSSTLASMSSTRARSVRTVVPSIDTAPSPAGLASSRSRAATLCTTIVYCWRSSSASAKRNGSSSWAQNCSSVQKKDVTPWARLATSGAALGSSRRGGAKKPTSVKAPAGRPRRR